MKGPPNGPGRSADRFMLCLARINRGCRSRGMLLIRCQICCASRRRFVRTMSLLLCPVMLTSIRRMVTVILTALAVVTTLTGCASSGGRSDGAPPEGSGGVVNQAQFRGSGLASAVDLIPDMPNIRVMFTDWSILGQQEGENSNTASFAGQLLSVDDVLQRDLGIRSTSADWEIDMWQTGHPETIVLRFNRHTDLASLAGKLTQLGYHASGSIFTSSLDLRRMWTLPLRNIGIAADRQLLVGGPDATAVRSVLAGSDNPLGHADSVTPLLALAAARLGRIATASIVVGSGACVTLADLMGLRATPAMLAALRKQFTGTFTRPQAEITALADPIGTTAVDALTFPDQGAARANKAGRSAAAKVVNEPEPHGIQVSDSTVTGRVLSFTLTARQPHDIVQGVLASTLGVDICP